MGHKAARRLRPLSQAQAVELMYTRARGYALSPEQETALDAYNAIPEVAPEPEKPAAPCENFRRVVEVGPAYRMPWPSRPAHYERDEFCGTWTIVGDCGSDWYLARGVQPTGERYDWDVAVHKGRCTLVD